MTAERALFILLRINAGVLLLAAPCALLPFAWMDAVHREALGLGSLADAPITRYMARSLSLVYAAHGAIVLYVTLHWERLRFAVPFLAWLHVVFGLSLLAIDLDAGLPTWWTVCEGPSLVVLGLVLVVLNRKARGQKSEVRDQPNSAGSADL
jgi:hypothetical protein